MPAIVRAITWEQKRHLFSDEEKAVLNANITGETICPRGFVVAVRGETRPLLEKMGLKPHYEDDDLTEAR